MFHKYMLMNTQKALQHMSPCPLIIPKMHWATKMTTDCYIIRALAMVFFNHLSENDVMML